MKDVQMKENRYYKFLIYISFFLSICSAMLELVMAVLTYPPFMLNISSAKKVALLDTFAVPILMFYASLILIDIKEKRLSISVKLSLVGAVAAMFAGRYAYRAFDITLAPYVFSGMALIFSPYLLCKLFECLFLNKTSNKIALFIAKAAFAFLVVLEILLGAVILFYNYRIIVVFICLVMFPAVQLLTNFCRFFIRPCRMDSVSGLMLAADMYSLSLAAFIILRIFSQSVALIVLKAAVLLSCFALIIGIIYILKEKANIKG